MNADGTLTYTPARNYLGADSFTYQVTDGQLESNVANVTVSVLNDKTVKSNVSTTLSPTDLDLELTGKDNIWGTGNDWDNQIVGNKGKNVLNGMGGADRLPNTRRNGSSRSCFNLASRDGMESRRWQ